MDPAIEENGEELLVALGRAAGAEERDDGRVRWVIGDIPIDYHNCVVRADLSPEEADGVILESLERFRAHGAPGSWHVGPSMRPADIGERLLAHGFSYGGDHIGMAVELSALPERVSAPDELIIERVRDEEGLAEWKDTLAAGPAEAEWVGEMYRRMALGGDVPWRHYLEWRREYGIAGACCTTADEKWRRHGGTGTGRVGWTGSAPQVRGRGRSAFA